MAIIVGLRENDDFKEQQLQRQMAFKPYFTQLKPDLRAAQRIGKEREDFDSVHIWIRMDLTGTTTMGRWASVPSPFLLSFTCASGDSEHDSIQGAVHRPSRLLG